VRSPLPPAPPLADARATLRPWAADDVEDLLRGARDPLVRRYRSSIPDAPDAAWARAWLAGASGGRERLELAVCAPGEPAALGSVSLWGIHHGNRDAMVSWWLGTAGRGRGLGSAAVSLLAGWAFTELGMARIGATIEEANAPSRRLAERCGFVREGRLRSYQRLRDGNRVDCLSYSLLPEDLRRRA
jgi:RimJ/RimL family protein N-acetyltransferase